MRPPDADGQPEASAALKALADPVRLRMMALLAAEQLCVCHLQDALGIRQTLASHHLRVLRDAGLVETEAHGRFIYYRLRAGGLDDVQDLVGALAAAAAGAPGKRPC